MPYYERVTGQRIDYRTISIDDQRVIVVEGKIRLRGHARAEQTRVKHAATVEQAGKLRDTLVARWLRAGYTKRRARPWR